MKYGSGLSIKEVCALEIEECLDTLSRYKVPVEESLAIADMISEGYYQFNDICLYSKKFDAFLKDSLPKGTYDKIQKQFYLTLIGRRPSGEALSVIIEEELQNELNRKEGSEWYE